MYRCSMYRGRQDSFYLTSYLYNGVADLDQDPLCTGALRVGRQDSFYLTCILYSSVADLDPYVLGPSKSGAVLRTIRIRMFWSLLNPAPDPLVPTWYRSGSDPSIIKQIWQETP
jgi:hypothetical protein